MADADFKAFQLVGGTALSLQLGHRMSYDLDLFGFPEALDTAAIQASLNEYGVVELLTASRNILSVRLNGIKVDVVRYQYPLLKPFQEIERLRLVSLEDIAAMKLAAITGRGRKRDFTDLYFLLEHFSLAQMLGFYEQKYKDGNQFLVLKSLGYFEDAEEDEELLLFRKVDWTEIKKAIDNAVATVLS